MPLFNIHYFNLTLILKRITLASSHFSLIYWSCFSGFKMHYNVCSFIETSSLFSYWIYRAGCSEIYSKINLVLPKRCDADATRMLVNTHWKKNPTLMHFWFKGHHNKAKQMLCHRVPAPFYCHLRTSACSLWRGGDQLINWVTGLLRGNRMQIESGHRGDSHKVSVLS